MSDKMREAYKMRRAKLAGQLIQGEDWPDAYRRADEILSWSCFEAGWQASRLALVVGLPDLERPTADGMSAIFACKKAIESLGLRVKP